MQKSVQKPKPRTYRAPAATLPATSERAAGTLRALDLFAGAGGLSRGFEWAGLGQVVGAIEIDEAAATLALGHGSRTFARWIPTPLRTPWGMLT
jgi:hypothetical protein